MIGLQTDRPLGHPGLGPLFVGGTDRGEFVATRAKPLNQEDPAAARLPSHLLYAGAAIADHCAVPEEPCQDCPAWFESSGEFAAI